MKKTGWTYGDYGDNRITVDHPGGSFDLTGRWPEAQERADAEALAERIARIMGAAEGMATEDVEMALAAFRVGR